MRYYIFKRSRKGYTACFSRKEDLFRAILLAVSDKEVKYSKTTFLATKEELKDAINEYWGCETGKPFAYRDVLFNLVA